MTERETTPTGISVSAPSGRPRDDPKAPEGVDGTPSWAYDEFGCCVCCGHDTGRLHWLHCDLRDALDALAAAADEGITT